MKRSSKVLENFQILKQQQIIIKMLMNRRLVPNTQRGKNIIRSWFQSLASRFVFPRCRWQAQNFLRRNTNFSTRLDKQKEEPLLRENMKLIHVFVLVTTRKSTILRCRHLALKGTSRPLIHVIPHRFCFLPFSKEFFPASKIQLKINPAFVEFRIKSNVARESPDD